MTEPAAPRHLSSTSRRFWRDTLKNFELEAHHRRILQAALEAWDRMTEARETIAQEGATYRDRFGAPRKHPSVSIEESARTAFLRAIRELDLEGEPGPDPRPPGR